MADNRASECFSMAYTTQFAAQLAIGDTTSVVYALQNSIFLAIRLLAHTKTVARSSSTR
jgi:hypothetical protein